MPAEEQTRCLVGLVGTGIGESLSPALHEHEADALGIRYLYRLLDLDVLRLSPLDLGRLIRAARDLGFTGLNVTYPCKQLVLPHLDELSPEARLLGAVNTIRFEASGATGYNTDLLGFQTSLERTIGDLSGQQVLLLGTGGAGAAAAHGLLHLGVARLALHDLDLARASALADVLRQTFGADRALPVTASQLRQAIVRADGIVNATPLGSGLKPGSPVEADLLDGRQWVADVVYRPLATALLRSAAARGCRVVDGGGMAVLQAAAAFRLFTGREPEVDRMLGHFDQLVAEEPRVGRP